MSGGVTTNYGLAKPNFNVRPWDSSINGNFDLIDTLLYTLFQIPNIAGVWKNSTQYIAGQNVLDPQNLVFYTCLVNNVSAATGLFSADRAANPTYWTLTQPQIGSVRYDQGQALTAGQIQQALTNIATLSTTQMQAMFLRYDAAQTLSYNQILQVLNTLLIDGTESILTAAATTDVGNAGSMNVRIDGTTSIVSFGARPNKLKFIRFTGSLLLSNSASLVLPSGQNIQTLAGDTCIATSDANNNWYIRAYQRADGLPLPGTQVFGQCQFQYVSATQCKLAPLGGGLLTVGGVATQIPSAGVLFANTLTAQTGGAALANSTLCYAYVYNNAGVLTGEFSTTGFTLDAKGFPLKTGDSSRTLVGMVYTNGSGQFVDSDSTRYVATYFSRIFRRITAFQSTGGTGSTTPIIGSTSSGLSWGTDAVWLSSWGYGTNTTDTSAIFLVAAIVDAAPSTKYGGSGGFNAFTSRNMFMSSSFVTTPALGRFSIGPGVYVSAGVANYGNLTTEGWSLQ